MKIGSKSRHLPDHQLQPVEVFPMLACLLVGPAYGIPEPKYSAVHACPIRQVNQDFIAVP